MSIKCISPVGYHSPFALNNDNEQNSCNRSHHFTRPWFHNAEQRKNPRLVSPYTFVIIRHRNQCSLLSFSIFLLYLPSFLISLLLLSFPRSLPQKGFEISSSANRPRMSDNGSVDHSFVFEGDFVWSNLKHRNFLPLFISFRYTSDDEI